MAITTTNVSDVYNGDGTTDTFSITFDHYLNSQIEVSLYDTVTEATTVQTEGPDFTFDTLNGPSTSITFTAPPASDEQVIIKRVTAVEQTDVYSSVSVITAATLEQKLDFLTMMMQEAQKRIDDLETLTTNLEGRIEVLENA